jgi:RNA 3'-terminal phosphate cyclase (ATP)
MIEIDGSQGEGGGQVLRTSLALSMVTDRPFRIQNIRAGRKKPGLMRQHLTSVNAAVAVSQAGVQGNEIGSQELEFFPGSIKPGNYHFSVGTAGSTTLVCQTVLPALMVASGPSTLTLEGGTHNPFAPPFDFLEKVFAPVVERMGPKIDLKIEGYGFYPAGGGKIQIQIEPEASLSPIDLVERGEMVSKKGEVFYAHLPHDIAERELKVIGKRVAISESGLNPRKISKSPGPGNMVAIILESEQVTEVFTEFGRQGLKAERVAERACKQALDYLSAKVPVGIHLADQLLIPMALAGGGRFKTLKPDPHTLTNIEVIREFIDISIEVMQISDVVWEIVLQK